MKIIFIFCAICCFLAILKLPIGYYTFLRILVSVGAILAIYNFQRIKIYSWLIIFAIILILFNPIFPIYLHRKILWMPLDIITGILFLFVIFYKKVNVIDEKKPDNNLPNKRVFSRDRIIHLMNNQKIN